MEFNRLHEYVQVVTTLLVDGFVLGFTALIIAIIVMYIADITQTSHAIRRNYPVVGRFRYLFENMGEFFRQYFFAQDREELPFNRAERAWVYRSAKNVDSTVAFGSTRSLNPPGTVIFSNTAFPKLTADSVDSQAMEIGPLLPGALPTTVDIQYFSHELRCHFKTGHLGPVERCKNGRLLDKYR